MGRLYIYILIFFTRSGPQARAESWYWCVSVCLSVCLCVPSQDKSRQLGTLWISWTFRYLCQPWTCGYALSILNLQVPFANLGPVGTFFQPCKFRHPLPHGIDLNSWQRLGLMIMTWAHGIDLESWYRLAPRVKTWTNSTDTDSWY